MLNDRKVEQIWCKAKVCDIRILIGYIYSPNLFAENIEMLNSFNMIDHLMTQGYLITAVQAGIYTVMLIYLRKISYISQK